MQSLSRAGELATAQFARNSSSSGSISVTISLAAGVYSVGATPPAITIAAQRGSLTILPTMVLPEEGEGEGEEEGGVQVVCWSNATVVPFLINGTPSSSSSFSSLRHVVLQNVTVHNCSHSLAVNDVDAVRVHNVAVVGLFHAVVTVAAAASLHIDGLHIDGISARADAGKGGLLHLHGLANVTMASVQVRNVLVPLGALLDLTSIDSLSVTDASFDGVTAQTLLKVESVASLFRMDGLTVTGSSFSEELMYIDARGSGPPAVNFTRWAIKDNTADSGIVFFSSNKRFGLNDGADVGTIHLSDSALEGNILTTSPALSIISVGTVLTGVTFLKNVRLKPDIESTRPDVASDLLVLSSNAMFQNLFSSCKFGDAGLAHNSATTRIHIGQTTQATFDNCIFQPSALFKDPMLFVDGIASVTVALSHFSTSFPATDTSMIAAMDHGHLDIVGTVFDVTLAAQGSVPTPSVETTSSIAMVLSDATLSVVGCTIKLRVSQSGAHYGPIFLRAAPSATISILQNEFHIDHSPAFVIIAPSALGDEIGPQADGHFTMTMATISGRFFESPFQLDHASARITSTTFANITTDDVSAVLRISNSVSITLSGLDFANNSAPAMSISSSSDVSVRETSFSGSLLVNTSASAMLLADSTIVASGVRVCDDETVVGPAVHCASESSISGSFIASEFQGDCNTRDLLPAVSVEPKSTAVAIMCGTTMPTKFSVLTSAATESFVFAMATDAPVAFTFLSQTGDVLVDEVVQNPHVTLSYLDSAWANDAEFFASILPVDDDLNNVSRVKSSYLPSPTTLDMTMTNFTATTGTLGVRWGHENTELVVSFFNTLGNQLLARDLNTNVSLALSKSDIASKWTNCGEPYDDDGVQVVSSGIVGIEAKYEITPELYGSLHVTVCVGSEAKAMGKLVVVWHGFLFIGIAFFAFLALMAAAFLIRRRYRVQLKEMEEIVEIQRIKLNDYEEWEQAIDPENLPNLDIVAKNQTSLFESPALADESLLGLPRFDFADIAALLKPANRISRGAFGEVFKCLWKDETVAVKLISTEDGDRKAIAEAFVDEVTTLHRADHPCIMRILAACFGPRDLAFISECLERGSLFRVLHDRAEAAHLTLQRRVDMALQAAMGMAYLHSHDVKIVHRDVKSMNILVGTDWSVKIADFGLAKTMATRSFLSAKQLAGTPAWMSPEALRSESCSAKSDVFSFGVVLWELMTGRVPWEGERLVNIIRDVGLEGKRLDTSLVRQRASNDTEATAVDTYAELVDATFAENAAERPSFAEIVRALARIADLVGGPLKAVVNEANLHIEVLVEE